MCSVCRYSTHRKEAVNSLGNIDVSVVFVPAAGVKDAAISAIEAGIKLAVLVPDRVPVWDAMEIAAAAKANACKVSRTETRWGR
jgi:succinyl-CoA synthetase alpha subunit